MKKTVKNVHFLNFIVSTKVYCGFDIKENQNRIIGFSVLEPYMTLATFSELTEVICFIDNEYIGKGIGILASKKIGAEARKRRIKKYY